MIVLNEVLYAEEWLEKDVPWKKAGHVLHYVAKYYFYKGYSKDDVREKLNEYMLRHFEGYNKVLDRELIDKAIASALSKSNNVLSKSNSNVSIIKYLLFMN